LKYAFWIAAGLAALFASVMLWMGLAHNPQGEFYGSEPGTNWAGIVSLWGIPFVAVFIVAFPVFAALVFVINRARRP
jgi:hypothetical protein